MLSGFVGYGQCSMFDIYQKSDLLSYRIGPYVTCISTLPLYVRVPLKRNYRIRRSAVSCTGTGTGIYTVSKSGTKDCKTTRLTGLEWLEFTVLCTIMPQIDCSSDASAEGIQQCSVNDTASNKQAKQPAVTELHYTLHCTPLHTVSSRYIVAYCFSYGASEGCSKNRLNTL